MNKMIPSINYHLWKPCNASCKFCFASFEDTKEYLPKGHLSKEESFELIDEIILAGFDKITFVGGEPTLCPWLPELIKKAKLGGLTTMLTTNGFLLDDNYLNKLNNYLDWIALSIDSLHRTTNLKTGRYTQNIIPDETFYKNIIKKIKNHGFRLKINTVVSKLNYSENLSKFIFDIYPERWKVFQVLPIKKQNDKNILDFKINTLQFNLFKHNHQRLLGIDVVFENNEAMVESYLMIDPAGRFIDNSNQIYKYSSPILEVGVSKAYAEININYKKFIKRNGLYNWSNDKDKFTNFYDEEIRA
jgi:radical S-adenosyl methionine domain-containing protein 2